MDPLRVDPAAVPDNAVRVMKRTLLRHADAIAADPQDEELARLIVAVAIAALRPADAPAAKG